MVTLRRVKTTRGRIVAGERLLVSVRISEDRGPIAFFL